MQLVRRIHFTKPADQIDIVLVEYLDRVVLDYGDTSSMDLRASGTLSGKARLEATVS